MIIEHRVVASTARGKTPSRVRVWDLLVRIFHWSSLAHQENLIGAMISGFKRRDA